MTSRCLKTLSTLTVLAGAPLIAQAEMEMINNDDLSAVSGQLSLTFNNTTTVEGDASLPNNPNPLLLPITAPLAILDGFTSGVLDNAGGLGASAREYPVRAAVPPADPGRTGRGHGAGLPVLPDFRATGYCGRRVRRTGGERGG